ncbi:MAG: hypothetical protein AAF610_06600 [Pseudomonadota bacterium]
MDNATLPEIVSDDRALEDFANGLSGAPVVALDTEFMRVNTYFPRLCLVQLHDGSRTVCVDTLAVSSLTPLWDALTSGGHSALLHSARQDLEAFQVSEGRLPDRLLDTQVAAGLTGPDDQISYAQLVENVSGVTLPKSQTRTNWAKRPLSSKQLQYAADDVIYLPQIMARMRERLDQLGRIEWFAEDCERLLAKELYTPDIDRAYLRCKTRAKLNDQQRGALRALCGLRERVAIDRNKPRKWIIDDAGIEGLATLDAPSPDSVLRVLKTAKAHRGLGIEDVLDTIASAKPTADHRRGRPSPEENAAVARVMAEIRERAAELDISPGVLCARKEAERLVRGKRDLPVLTGWRRSVVGDALLNLLDAA